MVETKRHGDAFDYYYSLGNDRTLSALQVHCKCSPRAVANWSKAFNWKERIIQRDLEINKRTEEKTNNAIVNTKADYRADIKKNRDVLVVIRQRFEKLVEDATEKIESGVIEIKDVTDLDKVATSLKKLHDLDREYIKLDLILVGDSDQREDQGITIQVHGVDMEEFPEPYVVEKDEEDAP